jgi:hypothetical protein
MRDSRAGLLPDPSGSLPGNTHIGIGVISFAGAKQPTRDLLLYLDEAVGDPRQA